MIDPFGLRVSVVWRPLFGGLWPLGYHQAISVNGEIYGFHAGEGVIREDPRDYNWGRREVVVHPGDQYDQLFLDYLRNAAQGNDLRFTGDTYCLATNVCYQFVDTALLEAPTYGGPCP